MGRDAPQIQQAKVNIYNRTTQDADLFDNVMTQFTGPDPVAAMYPACHAITRFCEREIDNERNQIKSRSAAEDLGRYTEIKKLSRKMQSITDECKSLETAWAAIKNQESIGRIHGLKARSDLKKEMDDGLRSVTEALGARNMVQMAQSNELARQRTAMLASLDGGPPMMNQRGNRQSLSLYEAQLKAIDKEIGFSDANLGTVTMKIPS